jgi:hypothetical protein
MLGECGAKRFTHTLILFTWEMDTPSQTTSASRRRNSGDPGGECIRGPVNIHPHFLVVGACNSIYSRAMHDSVGSEAG